MSSCKSVEQMIFLTTSDGTEFMVTEALTTMSQTMGNLIKDGCSYINIELPNITANILKMVIQYCEIHVFKKKRTKPCTAPDERPIMLTEKEIENWDKEFVNVDVETVLDLIIASYYLRIPKLRDLASGSLDEEFFRVLIMYFLFKEMDEIV